MLEVTGGWDPQRCGARILGLVPPAPHAIIGRESLSADLWPSVEARNLQPIDAAPGTAARSPISPGPAAPWVRSPQQPRVDVPQGRLPL